MPALLAFPFLLAFLIWFAARTDNVALAIGMTISAVVGTWWHDKRKSRARQRRNEANYP
ncbi:hypothetical protein GMA12_11810 [Kocuria sediminis]|uniref:Uncharacterized protein n=1 Tax=Kocuria sediminis TaxID=1038857 RepID=A0A6N8GSA6_9MICC|nr:hypothetical protein [Kocuria sediminis]MUN63815.1 hypothetical protein [Kocuria sediminis]